MYTYVPVYGKWRHHSNHHCGLRSRLLASAWTSPLRPCTWARLKTLKQGEALIISYKRWHIRIHLVELVSTNCNLWYRSIDLWHMHTESSVSLGWIAQQVAPQTARSILPPHWSCFLLTCNGERWDWLKRGWMEPRTTSLFKFHVWCLWGRIVTNAPKISTTQDGKIFPISGKTSAQQLLIELCHLSQKLLRWLDSLILDTSPPRMPVNSEGFSWEHHAKKAW